MQQQINPAMSSRATYLEKNGWRLVSSKKRGMFRIQRWWKRGRGEGTMNQETAYANERRHQAWLKAEAALAAESQPATTTINAASNLGYKETQR